MGVRVDGLPSRYNEYKVNVDKIKKEIEKKKGGGSLCDEAVISAEGKKALENRMSALAEHRGVDGIRHLSSVSSYGYISDFEKALSDLGKGNVDSEYMTGNYEKEVANIVTKFESEEGEKTDSFERHVNKMVSVYNLIRDRIEKKYSDFDKEVEYYVADNGEIEELTKEKELEMLDKAYANHSEFMATSTEIWQTLNEDVLKDEEKGNTKAMASQAFMSAVREENRALLVQQKGSLNHFKLELDISTSARNMLNGIWNYYANKV